MLSDLITLFQPPCCISNVLLVILIQKKNNIASQKISKLKDIKEKKRKRCVMHETAATVSRASSAMKQMYRIWVVVGGGGCTQEK